MTDLMHRLSELCPEWCVDTDYGLVVHHLDDLLELPLSSHNDDVENAAATHAIVERMVEAGWAVNRYYFRQHGVMFHDCELVWPDDSRDTILTTGGSETEAVLRAAVAAFGGKE